MWAKRYGLVRWQPGLLFSFHAGMANGAQVAVIRQ